MTAEGDMVSDRQPPRVVKGAGVALPHEVALESSFSSAQGWELYKAVHGAVHTDEGSSTPRLRNEAATRPTQGQAPRDEVGPGQEEVEASVRPADQASSHGDSQRDWDAEQDWLQECADACHEIGPWADLVG